MGIFSSKIELNNKIKDQEQQINKLISENENLTNKNKELTRSNQDLSSKNKSYEHKYVSTGLECEFCYTVLQKDFSFCPKCGKKIEKEISYEVKTSSTSLFGVENDKDCVLINQYNSFNDKKVVIPSKIHGKPVIGIWNGVFKKCVDLEEVIFEEGCKYIGKDAFADCVNLKKVKLPKSLLEIGDGAFCGCSSLTEIAIPPSIEVVGDDVFAKCSSLKDVFLPDGLKYISDGMFANTSIDSIQIPESVLHIGNSAFSNTNISEVELPKNLYSIESNAFATKCLSKIVVHSNVKIIWDMVGRNTDAVIYCAAGSKAQLLARQHGYKCVEIAPQRPYNGDGCVKGMKLMMGSTGKNFTLQSLYYLAGIYKASTWSWSYQGIFTMSIDATMSRNNAITLRNKLENYIITHSDYNRPDVAGHLNKIELYERWGVSEV